ncbi:hypothetical protein NKH18_44115 [Streptomyces sp. M10(2022)]
MTTTSGATASHEADGDASWRDIADAAWLAAAWRRAGAPARGSGHRPRAVTRRARRGPEVPAAGTDAVPPETVAADSTLEVDARDLVPSRIEETHGGRPEGAGQRAAYAAAQGAAASGQGPARARQTCPVPPSQPSRRGTHRRVRPE